MSEGGLPSPETVSGILIATTFLHGLGLILTSFRLWFRYHTRRLWWDDFWVAVALLCDAVDTVAMWIINAPLDNPYINYGALPTPTLTRSAHVTSIWLAILSYTCTIWFTRISIVFSMVRIVPPTKRVSITAFGTGAMFLCLWAYVLTCKSVVCSADKSWYDATVIQCPIPRWVALSEVTTDVFSDIVLVTLPLCFLWRVRLPSNQRIMVLSVFSTSILVSVVSAIHTAYTISEAVFVGGVTAEMGGAVSLIVCNLLVIVTFVYRTARCGRDLTAGLSDKHTGTSNALTTIDLGYVGSSLFTSQTTGTETRFTGTELSGANVSSLVSASRSGRETTFDPVIASSGPVPETSPPLASVAMTH